MLAVPHAAELDILPVKNVQCVRIIAEIPHHIQHDLLCAKHQPCRGIVMHRRMMVVDRVLLLQSREF